MNASELAELFKRHGEWIGAGMPIGDPRRADLRGADLRGAGLIDAKDGPHCRLDFGGWSICIRAAETTIGCQRKSNADWLSWTHDAPEIAAMHADAPEWWRVHGDVIKAAIRCVMAKTNAESVK